MRFNRGDIPYLYEYTDSWQTLPNDIKRQIGWEYSIMEVAGLNVFEDDWPVIVEAVSHRLHYRIGDYDIIARIVDEWRYLNKPDEKYAGVILGYRGYWQGSLKYEDKPHLQPEVSIMLCLTPDFDKVPPYIETISRADLRTLLEQAEKKFADDDMLAFPKTLPIETPVSAPDMVRDSLRRMRAQTRLMITRGRAALLEGLMPITGTWPTPGGWEVKADEIERRLKLKLR